MSEKKGQNFLHGAAIYTVGIIIIKILGAIYKIPLGNILGDEGYNHFDLTYRVYNVFLTISTAGIPVAMSRMISEADTLDREQQVYRIFRVGVATFLGLGAAGTLIMMLFPAGLASLVGDVQATQCIFVMAPSVVLVCVTAAYRGYAQGHADMIPSTVSQIIETGVKVVVGLACAGILYSMGKSLEICAAGAILGTTVSSLVAMLYMQVIVHHRYQVKPKASEAKDVPDSNKKILWDLLRIGIPITISTSVMSLIQLADSAITLNQLQNSAGYTAQAAYVLNGAYGKAMTVYNVPSAFVTPFVASLMPAISAARVRGDRKGVCDTAESGMRMCTLLCLPMAIGMAVLAGPCMQVLYPTTASQGTILLVELGITCYFMTMSVMTNSILPANGNERLPLISILCGGTVKVIVTYVLVGNPDINVYGAPIGTLCCYIVMLTMNLIFMAKHMERPVNMGRVFGRAGLSAGVMGVSAWAVWSLLHGLMGGMEATIINRPVNVVVPFLAAVLTGVVVYAIMIVATRAITMEDMKLIPKGEKLAKLLHIH
ncbi:MAG: polysaccharide biosynthesis protein [Oscillospiraceae bacterium]|nr:polysaccharide biosynthesis protein [Oscillospiraceae bacterium]